MNILIANIQKYSFAKGLTPAEACRNAGIGDRLLITMRNGSVPSVERIAKLAKYLDVTSSDLIGDAKTE